MIRLTIDLGESDADDARALEQAVRLRGREDRHPIRHVEAAIREAIFRNTGRDVEVRVEVGDALRDLLADRQSDA